MLKTILKVLVVLVISLGGGIWVTDYTLDNSDPYSKARAARKAYLAIGTAEGLPFYARRDSNGRELRRGCSYRLTGLTPSTRFWTLYPANTNLEPIVPREGLQTALHSREMLYDNDGRVQVTVGPNASPDNWLPVEGSGSFVLVMTLYDTPAASSSGLVDLVMPRIVPVANLEACRG
jgi:hypothetical protein